MCLLEHTAARADAQVVAIEEPVPERSLLCRVENRVAAIKLFLSSGCTRSVVLGVWASRDVTRALPWLGTVGGGGLLLGKFSLATVMEAPLRAASRLDLCLSCTSPDLHSSACCEPICPVLFAIGDLCDKGEPEVEGVVAATICNVLCAGWVSSLSCREMQEHVSSAREFAPNECMRV